MSVSSRLLSRLALVPTVVAGLLLSSLSVAAPAEAQKVRPGFFGIHSRTISNGTLPGVEIGSIRLWDSGTSWRQIETSDNTFSFGVLDRAVNTARAAGIRPMIVLGQTPQFHARNPNASGPYGAGATSMPNLNAWKRYVGVLARRYGDTVDYQVWNEPNVDSYWAGSPAQMATLTKIAGQQITRVVGRRATVVAPSLPVRLLGQRRWYAKYWGTKLGRQSVAAFVDVVAVNAYPMPRQSPEASTKLVRFAKSALPRAARRKQMWNTEINFGLNSGGDTLKPARRIPEARQAAYVARTLVLNAVSPIRRVYWYSWGVGPIANTHLVEEDGVTLTRAGRAWGVAKEWLGGTDAKKCAVGRRGKMKGVYVCTLRKSRREVRRVYWKPSGKAVTVRAPRKSFASTSLSGDTTRRRGQFAVKVSQAPVMVASRR